MCKAVFITDLDCDFVLPHLADLKHNFTYAQYDVFYFVLLKRCDWCINSLFPLACLNMDKLQYPWKLYR